MVDGIQYVLHLLEIMVEQTMGAFGGFRDVVDGGVVVADVDEGLQGALHQFLSAFVFNRAILFGKSRHENNPSWALGNKDILNLKEEKISSTKN